MALCNSPKEDLGNFFPTDFVLGHPIQLPGEFSDVSKHDGSSIGCVIWRGFKRRNEVTSEGIFGELLGMR